MRFDAKTAISVLRHMSFPLATGLVPYLVRVGFNTLDREFLDETCPRMIRLTKSASRRPAILGRRGTGEVYPPPGVVHQKTVASFGIS
jgi:hypothetical protein